MLWFLMQFPDVVTFSEKMANKGKTVVVAALDGTFQRKVGTLMYGSFIQLSTGFVGMELATPPMAKGKCSL